MVEILTELGRKSLLIVDASGAVTRFRMLETIRQYAAAKLTESGEADSVRQRHALYYYEVASAAAQQAATPAEKAAPRRFDLETPNLREALEWSTAASRNVYLGEAIAAQLVEVWEARGDFVEAEHWLRRALDSESGLLTIRTRAKLHEGLAMVGYRQGRLFDAVHEASNALKNYASIDDSEGKLRARDLLGLAVMENGELDVARSQFEETLSEARAANDPRAISASLNNLSRLVGEYEGRFDLAMPMFAESLSTARTNGLASQAVSALTNLSQCTLALGQYTAGTDLCAAWDRRSGEARKPRGGGGLGCCRRLLTAFTATRSSPFATTRFTHAKRSSTCRTGRRSQRGSTMWPSLYTPPANFVVQRRCSEPAIPFASAARPSRTSARRNAGELREPKLEKCCLPESRSALYAWSVASIARRIS